MDMFVAIIACAFVFMRELTFDLPFSTFFSRHFFLIKLFSSFFLRKTFQLDYTFRIDLAQETKFGLVCQINRKITITIKFWFDLTRF